MVLDAVLAQLDVHQDDMVDSDDVHEQAIGSSVVLALAAFALDANVDNNQHHRSETNHTEFLQLDTAVLVALVVHDVDSQVLAA